MRTLHFVIFFSLFLLLYGLINYYIFSRLWTLIPKGAGIRQWFAAGFILLASSYIGGRIIERYSICVASDLAILIGSFWLAIMTYLFIGFVVVDILRLLGHAIPLAGKVFIEKREFLRYIAAAIIATVAITTVTAGYINAARPRLRTIDIDISDKTLPPDGIRIALATDIHLGVIIGNSRLERLVEKINAMRPDVILLAGDIVDEDLAPVIEQNLGETLRGLRSKHGVYAVTGNHEYIGGVEAAVQYLTEHGITVLRDRAVLVDGKYYLAGREDRSITGFAGLKRKPLDEIIEKLDKRFPIILMDHQPFHLDEAVANGIDLQLSGHTHNGQMWPFNYITGAIYELDHGYTRKVNTHFYVSSGFGTWGPPVRVGTKPEIVLIRINNRK